MREENFTPGKIKVKAQVWDMQCGGSNREQQAFKSDSLSVESLPQAILNYFNLNLKSRHKIHLHYYKDAIKSLKVEGVWFLFKGNNCQLSVMI